QTGSSRNRSHDDVYRDHDRSCRSTAAAAMINYEANAPLAAFAPQNDAAAVSAQNPVAGCDTNEAPIFQGQWPLHYLHEPAFAKAAITLLAVRPSHNSSAGFFCPWPELFTSHRTLFAPS